MGKQRNNVLLSFNRALPMLMLLLISVAGISGSALAQTGLSTTLCGLVTNIEDAIFVVALALMILGGSLYAAAHILPSAQKGALQSYGMGMIIGGVVGIILVLLAPTILSSVAGAGGVSSYTTCSSIFGGPPPTPPQSPPGGGQT